MLLIIVATGNHFFVDAALGGLAVLVGWLAARMLLGIPAPRRHVPRVATSAGRA
jgi:hypothetical protein